MIEIINKKDCCGCHACATVCAKHSITMQADEEGFLYPVVDKGTCVECGLCEKVCPIINQNDSRKPLKVYAAKNQNEEVRKQSSSGGIFTLLAEAVIAENGVVFGARFDESWNVVHSWTDTIEDLDFFRGSKYVQSTIGSTYKEAREFLQQGRKVLFSGTPCQIAGLKRYLRKEYENLLTVDVVCHGVPSPLVWRRYLDDMRSSLSLKYNVVEGTHFSPIITDISFRDKKNGWKKYCFRLRYIVPSVNAASTSVVEEEYEFLQPFTENDFMKGFLRNIYLRPSCYACSARSGKSGSDISIADFWGVQNFYPEFDDDKGIGLILINSDKGEEVYRGVCTQSVLATYEQGLANNPSIEHSAAVPQQRNLFVFNSTQNLNEQLTPLLQSMRPNVILRVYRDFRIKLGMIKRMIFK